MKILQLIQKKQLRGAEVFTAQLSSHLEASGHQVVIVPCLTGVAELPFKGKFIQLQGKANKKYWDLAAWKKLAQVIKKEQPDVVQANAGDTLKYAVFSKLLFRWRQPIIFRNASTISLYIKTPFVKRLYRFLFNRTQKIISVSQASAKDFATLYPGFKQKISTIPIGIEQLPAIENKTFQNPFAEEAAGPVLVHVGGFTFEKNHEGLIRIFEKVLAQVPAARLYLLGDGPLRKEIETLVAQKKPEEQSVFKGFQQNPLQWVQHADVLLLPSHIEGLPGVILEAFYCQTPVVAYDTGGIREVVIPNETGRLIEKNKEDVFAEAVLQALEDNTCNRQLIENAYRLVTTQYMNTKVAKGFLNVYETVLS